MPISLSLPSSSVQHECIPQALLGMDIICQAKSGKVNFFLILCCENIVQSLSSVLLMRYKYEIFISLTVLLLLFPSSSLHSSRPHLTVSDYEYVISVCASHCTEITSVLQLWNLLNISSFFYHFVSIFSFLTIALIICFLCRIINTQVPIYVIAHIHIFSLFFLLLFLGMGKTAVFVLATLHQLTPVAGECHVIVLCHTR